MSFPRAKPSLSSPPHSHSRSSSLGNDYNELLVIVPPPHMLRGRLTPSCPLLLSHLFLMKTNVHIWYIYVIHLHCILYSWKMAVLATVILRFFCNLYYDWKCIELYLVSLFFLRSLLLLVLFWGPVGHSGGAAQLEMLCFYFEFSCFCLFILLFILNADVIFNF